MPCAAALGQRHLKKPSGFLAPVDIAVQDPLNLQSLEVGSSILITWRSPRPLRAVTQGCKPEAGQANPFLCLLSPISKNGRVVSGGD